MTRVHVMVEGQTEETFVRKLLYDHLQRYGVFLSRREITRTLARRRP